MKRFLGTVLFFVLFGILCFGSFSAESELRYTPEQIDNFEKDGLFTVIPKEIIDEISLKIDYLYGILHPAKEKDNPKFLQFYLTSATDIPYGWDKTPYEIVQEWEAKQTADYQHFFYYAMSETQVGIFSFTHKNGTLRANKYPTGTGANPAGIGSLSGSLLDRELLSIDEYMVFENQICQVQNVMIFCDTNDLNSYIYYLTDKGDYVKYFTTVWEKSVGQKESPPLWFSVEEFNTVLETLYKEERIIWLEETSDPNYQVPVGGVSLNVLADLEKAGMDIPYCEAGNPIPAHLQAEIDALRGVDETTRTEDSDQSNGMSDTGSDLLTDEGTVDVSTETATLTDAAPTDGTADTSFTGANASDAPLTDGTDALPSDGTDSAPTATDTPTDPAPFPWLWVMVPAGVVLIAAATTALVIRKKKKQ